MFSRDVLLSIRDAFQASLAHVFVAVTFTVVQLIQTKSWHLRVKYFPTQIWQ